MCYRCVYIYYIYKVFIIVPGTQHLKNGRCRNTLPLILFSMKMNSGELMSSVKMYTHVKD